MLRITATDHSRVLSFLLEGRLEGPWVRELQQCWRQLLAGESRPILRVDLKGVTFIDAAGKAGLAEMQRQGAEFITSDPFTESIVAEIARGTAPDQNEKGEPWDGLE